MNRHSFSAACLRLAVAMLCALLVPVAQAARVKDLEGQGVLSDEQIEQLFAAKMRKS